MATFSFADYNSDETKMHDKMVREVIAIHSQTIVYFPLIKYDTTTPNNVIFGEDDTAGYMMGIPIKGYFVYPTTAEFGWDILGLHIAESLVMWISDSEYDELVTPAVSGYASATTMPKEGDLITTPGYKNREWEVSGLEYESWVTPGGAVSTRGLPTPGAMAYKLTLVPWRKKHEILNINASPELATETLSGATSAAAFTPENINAAITQASSGYIITEPTLESDFWSLDITGQS